MTSIPPYFAVFYNKKIETAGWRSLNGFCRAVYSRHSLSPTVFFQIKRTVDEERDNSLYNTACRQKTYYNPQPISVVGQKYVSPRFQMMRERRNYPLFGKHFLHQCPLISIPLMTVTARISIISCLYSHRARSGLPSAKYCSAHTELWAIGTYPSQGALTTFATRTTQAACTIESVSRYFQPIN